MKQPSHPLRIALTEKQARQLAPFFDRVNATAAMGTPGMLVGQFHYTRERGYYVTVAFLDHDKAQIITEAGRAQIPGRTLPTPTGNEP